MGTIRLLLALSVIAAHSTPILGFHLLNGRQAVEIFFIISGFYMSLILRGKYGHGARGTWIFFENRFLRLYPTYLVCVLLTWGIFFGQMALMHKVPTSGWAPIYQKIGWEKLPFIFSNWTMLGLDIDGLIHYNPAHGFIWFASPPGLILPDGSIPGVEFLTIEPAWSVGAEIWFYLLAPFFLRGRWPLLMIPLIGSLLFKFYMQHAWHYETNFFFPAQCCFFIVGACLHHFYEALSTSKLLPGLGRFGWVIVMISIISIGLDNQPVIKYLFYTTFCLFLPSIFACSKDWKLDRHIGNLSYSIYLLHQLVIWTLHSGLKITNGNLTAILTIVGSIAIYVMIEQPIDTFRQSLLRRHTAKG